MKIDVLYQKGNTKTMSTFKRFDQNLIITQSKITRRIFSGTYFNIFFQSAKLDDKLS